MTQERPPRPKPATLYDVARAAGVSHQTVSRLVKGHTGIRPETRDRVERALKELDYRPNMTARSLATSRSHRIGALAYELLQVAPHSILHGASEAAQESGYLLDILSLDPFDDRAIGVALERVREQDLAGVLAFAPTDAVCAAVAATRFRVPVYVDSEPDADESVKPSLSTLGSRVVAEHLISLGHRRFAHISGPRPWVSARNREAALQASLREHGLQPAIVVEGDWSPASGYAAARALSWHDAGRPTALAVSNDQMALGALRALEEMGVRVPEDVSVTGYDDIPEAAYFSPPLTTVRVDFGQQGRIAFERLLTLIDGVERHEELHAVVPELKLRASTAPLRR